MCIGWGAGLENKRVRSLRQWGDFLIYSVRGGVEDRAGQSVKAL